MEEMIRRAALRSAAKVAFGASVCFVGSLSACAGKSVLVEADGDGDESSFGGSSAGSAPAAGSATGVPDAAAPPPDLACNNFAATGDASDQLNCCSMFILERAAGRPVDGWGTDPGELAHEPSFVHCCQVLAEFSYFSDASLHCCFNGTLTPEQEVQPFCSPWGPPVPPALDAELEASA